MQYCLVQNDIIGRPQALPRNWDNISNFYLLAPEILVTYGWYPCHTSEKPAYDESAQRLVESLQLADGVVVQSWEVVDLTLEERLQYLKGKRQVFKKFLRDYMDQQVSYRDYDNIDTAGDWTDSVNPEWAAESREARQFREECYNRAYAIENAVLTGTRPIPTFEEFSAEMPVLGWEPPAPPDNGNLPSNGTI